MPGTKNLTMTGWRKVSRFYRRPPGLGWLSALAVIPLLIALIGYGISDRAKVELSAPDVAAPSLSVPGMSLPGLSFAPLSILRNGNVFTLNGQLPDIATRTGLLDMLKGVFGSGAKLVDNLSIKPGVTAPDLASLGAVFKAAVSLPDFAFKIVGDTVTLMGSAASDAVKSAVEAAAKTAWPNLKLVNDIRVSSAPDQSSNVAKAPESTAPAQTSGGDCGNLQADISAVMTTPVTFVTSGYTLSVGTQQQLSEVAQKAKGCHGARLVISGYTDNTGNDAINVPLSTARAKSVADYLVSQGVPADGVSAKGFGSADPVASNTTPDGRAQNRRVVITVS